MKKINRSKVIIKTSIIGILLNLVLVGFKAVIGLLTNSIAIVLDAINNLSDALNSIITIIGTKLATRRPDKEHPFGHGRIEYISSLLISIIILYMGVTALIDSFKHIISGNNPEYNYITIIIVGFAIFVKIFLGLYYKAMATKTNSEALYNSGTDALMDVIISSGVLVSTIIYMIFDLNIDAYVAAVISVFIIKSGIGMIKETLSIIVGERVDGALSKEIKKIATSFEEVNGCYDLTLNNYGPDRFIGSFHIEVSDKLNAVDIDLLTRKITAKVFRKTGVVVSAIGIYSLNINDKEALKMKSEIEKVIDTYDEILSMHGFYVNHDEKTINTDLVVSFGVKNKAALYNEVKDKFESLFDGYKVYLIMDDDVSD